MTKILIDDNSILATAVDKVSKGKVKDALRLFSKVDCYESMLNQMACLCCLAEHFYALEIYRTILSRYSATHNVAADIASMDSGVVHLIKFVDAQYHVDVVYDENRISANRQYVANYKDFCPETLSFFDESNVFLGDGDYFGEDFSLLPAKTTFFDVKSPNYDKQVCVAFYQAQNDDDSANAKKYAKILLSLDSSKAEVVQTQLQVALWQKKYTLACKFAKKLATFDDLDATAVSCAIEALSHKPKQYKQTIWIYLQRARQVIDELDIDDLLECMRYLTNLFTDYPLAEQFACKLIAFADCDVECLKACCYVFYNARNTTQLQRAITQICDLLPRDTFALFMRRHLTSTKTLTKFLDMPDKVELYLQAPNLFVSIARDHFILQDTDKLLLQDERDYLYLATLIYQCKYYGLYDKFDEFAKYTSSVKVVLDYFIPTNLDDYYKFCLDMLGTMYAEPSIIAIYDGIVASLLKYNYDKKLFLIARNGQSYHFDCGAVIVKKEAFTKALSLCASLCPVDVQKLESAFQQIEQLGLPVGDDLASTRKLAYCLLVISQTQTKELDLNELFVQVDFELYNAYVVATHGN